MGSKYNIERIQENIEKFKTQQYKPEDVTIYFDMDNTLCLWSPFGNTEFALKQMYSKGFYRELMCFSEAPAVIENLQKIGFKVKILSACIDSPYCRPEKKAWINYHIPTIKDEDIILVDVGENKANYIDNIQQSILVDDYCQNLIDFYEAGGIGIKKTYSGKQRVILQVESLVDIFSILYKLNCLNRCF